MNDFIDGYKSLLKTAHVNGAMVMAYLKGFIEDQTWLDNLSDDDHTFVMEFVEDVCLILANTQGTAS